jgi:Tol biopolymer transport system component
MLIPHAWSPRLQVPIWSPDGRKIAFVSERNGHGDIYVMNPDGSGQRNTSRRGQATRVGLFSWAPQ